MKFHGLCEEVLYILMDKQAQKLCIAAYGIQYENIYEYALNI